MNFSEWAAGIAEWLLRSVPVSLVVSVERDGSMAFTPKDGEPPGDPPPALRGAAAEWTFREGTLRAVPDASRVTGAADQPETLFALHALAARWPQSRLILKLPPEHVGRRW